MIEVSSLKKIYKKSLFALKDVSFKVNRGEIMLLLGPNGAGKTTIIKIILGLIKASEGTVSLESNDIGYMPEAGLGKNEWTVEQYLIFIAKLKGYKNPRDRINSFFKTCIGSENRKKKMKNLSMGNKQKVKWVQAILTDPEILVLDEPTSNLDPIGKKMMRDFIQDEREKGKTILLSTHMLDEMEKIGDQYLIVNNGEVLEKGSVEEINEVGLDAHFLEMFGSN